MKRHGNISIFIPHSGCPHACSFCSQNVISGTEKAPSAEEVREIISSAYSYIDDKSETEIAFFGGSFTAIDRDYMTALLQTAEEFTGEGGFKGIRISTRPDYIDDEILSLLKAHHVTAIELGAQSMNDEVLELNRRGHTARQVKDACALIRKYSFELGLQIMTGLYGSSPELDRYTAERAVSLAPDTLRIYPTAIIDGTYLGELFKSGEYIPYSFEECIKVCAETLVLCHKKNIRVIRLGLHAEKSLEDKLLGGFYHPALAEIVRSELFRRSFDKTVTAENAEITVNPRDRSPAAGHGKSNVNYLLSKGTAVTFHTDENIPKDKYLFDNNIFDIYE